METVFEARWLLVNGALLTIQLFLISSGITIVAAVISGLARLSPYLFLRLISTAYTELFRGTSLVVQLFWLYYALPFLGIRLDTFSAAAIGLGLCFGAYGSEIVRGAISSIHHTQVEAAIALNLTAFDRMRRIIFPQALAAILPPFGNLLIQLLKGTATASLISLPELSFQASAINYQAQATIATFTVVLLVYFVLAQFIAGAISFAEYRLTAWRQR